MTDLPVAAIVLAAGKGTRFAAQANGAFKLVAPWRGEPLVRHVVRAALGSKARPLLLVTGHRRADVLKAVAGLDVVERHNLDFASGLASSLRSGLEAIPDDVAGSLVLLADMPRVTSGLLDLLIATFQTNPDCDAVVPTFGGRRGNPVLLGRRMFASAMRTTGDEGARKILAAAENVVEIAADYAVALDVDDPATLAALDLAGER